MKRPVVRIEHRFCRPTGYRETGTTEEFRKTSFLRICALVTVTVVLIAVAGCGEDADPSPATSTCTNTNECPDSEICLDDQCIEKPEAGTSCPEDYQGSKHGELECRDGTWREDTDQQQLGELRVITEPPAQVTEGETFETAFELRDEAGHRLETGGVDISLEPNRGTFSGGTVSMIEATDATGVAEFEAAIDVADPDYQLIGTVIHDGLEGPTAETGFFDVIVPSSRSVQFVDEPPQTVTAGQSFDVEVEIVDEHDEPVDGSDVDVSLTVNQHEFAGGSQELTAAVDDNGRATFEATTIEAAGSGFVLTATAELDDVETISANSDSFDVVSADAEADTSTIAGDEETLADGVDEAQITIELADAYGNPIVDVIPSFVASGDGNDYGDCTATDTDGLSICSMTSTAPGPKVLELTDPVSVVGEAIEFMPTDCNEDATPFGGGNGTLDYPHQICSPEQLNAIGDDSDYLDQAFVLRDDIDMAEIDTFNLIGDIDQHWSDPGSTPFSGVFDGDGHTIENLTIDATDEVFVGMFSGIDEAGIVTDLTLEEIDVAGNQPVGGLAGRSDGTLTNCRMTGNVEGTGLYVGGLVGFVPSGSISESEFSGSVIGGNQYTGGLVGRLNASIDDSMATGTVDGEGMMVGGLVGEMRFNGEIANSHSTSDVTGSGWYVGGLVGHTESSPNIVDSYAIGEISGPRYVGGLVGQNAGSIDGGFASGTVEAEHTVGGLVGQNHGDITRSHSTGDVHVSGQSAGGLAGTHHYANEIAESFATGDLIGDDDEHVQIGGLVGVVGDDAAVVASYATGDLMVTGHDIGGLVGRHAGSIVDAYSTGYVGGGDASVGGFVGNAVSGGVTWSYWDEDTSEKSSSSNGQPLSTDAFDDEESFEDWDFDDVWVIDEAPDGETRPVLQWQNE